MSSDCIGRVRLVLGVLALVDLSEQRLPPRRFNEANSAAGSGSYFRGLVVERKAGGNNSANRCSL